MLCTLALHCCAAHCCHPPTATYAQLPISPCPLLPPATALLCSALPFLQGDLIARLQELVKTQSDRRIVYQQKEGGSGSGGAPVAEAAAEASA